MQERKQTGGQTGRQEAPGPSPDEDGGKQYLIFKVGVYWLALSIDKIKRVHDAEGLPPRTPGSRILDLYQVVGAEQSVSPGYWIEADVGESKYLMPVENVEEIRGLGLVVPMPYPGILRKRETNYIVGLFFDGLRMISEIDPAEIGEMTRGRTNLAARARQTAEARKEENERREAARVWRESRVGKERRMVLFERGSTIFSVDLDMVVQITNRDEIHPIPSSEGGILGVVYYNDEAVPVMKKSVLKDKNGGGNGEDFDMIILAETPKGMVGLGSNRILGVVEKTAEKDKSGSGDIGGVDDQDAPLDDTIEITPEMLMGNL